MDDTAGGEQRGGRPRQDVIAGPLALFVHQGGEGSSGAENASRLVNASRKMDFIAGIGALGVGQGNRPMRSKYSLVDRVRLPEAGHAVGCDSSDTGHQAPGDHPGAGIRVFLQADDAAVLESEDRGFDAAGDQPGRQARHEG